MGEVVQAKMGECDTHSEDPSTDDFDQQLEDRESEENSFTSSFRNVRSGLHLGAAA